jgi:hypothetical protein
MIEKDTDQWLFPECFEYLLEHQNVEGGWDPLEQAIRTAKYPVNVWLPDCIIHSLAALLALTAVPCAEEVMFPMIRWLG